MKSKKSSISIVVAIVAAVLVYFAAEPAQSAVDRFRVTSSLAPGIFTSRAEAEAAQLAFSPAASVLQLVGTQTNKDTSIYSYGAVPATVESNMEIATFWGQGAGFSSLGPFFDSEEDLVQEMFDAVSANTTVVEECPSGEILNNDWLFSPFFNFGPGGAKTVSFGWFTDLLPDGTCSGRFSAGAFNVFQSFDFLCPAGYEPVGNLTTCVNNLTATITEVNLEYDLEPEECVGNPCNPFTGSKILSFRDVEAPGIVFERVWRSRVSTRTAFAGDPVQTAEFGRMPYGWSFSYGQRVLFGDTAVPDALYRPNGTLVPLEEGVNTPGVYSSANGSQLQLRQTASDEWTVFLSDGSKETYQQRTGSACSAGIVRLESVADPNGRVTAVEYEDECSLAPNMIRSPFGHTLEIQYQAFVDATTPRSIAEIIDSNGQSITFDYTLTAVPLAAPIQVLNTTTYQDNTVEIYHYEDSNFARFITGITDEENIRLSTYTYDLAGRTASSTWAGGFNSWTFDYRSNGEIHATDGRGLKTIYAVLDSDFNGTSDRRLVIRQSRIIKDTSNEDLNQQRRTSRKDSNFLSASYGFDDFNLVSMSVSGGTATRDYNYEYLNETSALQRFERGPSSCDDGTTPAREYETETTYVPETQLISSTIERGFRKDSSGTCVPIERTTTYSNHNSFGQPQLIDGPRTDVTDTFTVAYNECTSGNGCGKPATLDNVLGQRWMFDLYDSRGNLRKMTRPDGIATEYTYDLRNRLTATIETDSVLALSRTTTFSHYDNGLIKRITDPTGAYFEYIYDDARNLREIVDAFGNKVIYDYDLKRNRTSEQHVDATGTVHFRRGFGYDFFDQVDREFQPASDGGPDDVWQRVTDAAGLLQSATDPLGNVTNYLEYDDFRNLTTVQDATGAIAEYEFNPKDNLISVTTPNGSPTTYEYDDFGHVTKEVSPDRGTITYSYDVADNLLTKLDARGLLTSFNYDALNRLSSVNLHDGGSIIYEYDIGPNAIGRVNKITDATGTTVWAYDNFGAVAQKTQTIGTISLATSYNYDSQGRLDTMTLPSGKTVTYSYNVYQTNQVTVDGQTILSGATYEPFGPVNGWTWGNGDVSNRQFNLRGFMSSFTLAGDTRTLSYDRAGRLASALDNRIDESYGYDGLDRLTSFNPPNGSTSGPTFTAPPVLLTSIQTMKNEIGAVPTEPSAPWLTVATKNVSASGAKLSLERGQVNTGSIDVKEKIGYVAIEAASGSFLVSGEIQITYEAQTTPEFIQGWDTGCFETAFVNTYASKPVVMASLNSHNGGDGGWLRRCKLNTATLGLTVDEDKFADSERRHNNAESAGYVAFSAAFDAQFTDENGTWGMEIAKVILPSTAIDPVFTSVSFRQTYATKPVVIVLPNKSGNNPASVRIRNVTKNGFKVVQVEPAPQNGTHNAMPIHYLAIEPGSHTLPDGTKLEVGRKATKKQKHGSGVVGQEGWANVNFDSDASSMMSQVFDYDDNGNRTSLTEDGNPYTYSYLANSNRLLSTTGPQAKTISYDTAGNVIGDGSHTFSYDDRGRLVDVDFGAATYQYNGQGQRVRKHNGDTTLFVYGEDGELLGEYDALGNVIRETVWFSSAPVAVLTNTGTYHVHTDHLGTPRVITDGDTVIWRWESDPFGTSAAQEDPDGDSIPFTYNLRFSGQYYDVETGLHYNYFRTYDPSTGRYLESDPIGLLGGLNTYVYALQNPLRYVDPHGLDSIFDDVIPDGGFPNELVCRQSLRQFCSRVVRPRCQQLLCSKLGALTTCAIPCQELAAQCKVEADEFCAGQEFGEDDNLPAEPQRSYGPEGCYSDYRRTWYGKRELTMICPDDKDYKGEQCSDD